MSLGSLVFWKGKKKIIRLGSYSGNLNNSGDLYYSLIFDDLDRRLWVENGGKKRDLGEIDCL